jgi:pyrimidine-nucleoside phosphorylase
MRAVDIIINKRDGMELSSQEIQYFIEGYTRGEIPDYQAAAWAMAVLLKGMNARETADLTLAMANSGEILDLSGVVPIAVDKHSTGGVGDKTTLVVEPAVAACGLPVGKMSGRGLGFSGGTLDKIESIPGYRVDLTKEEFLEQLGRVGIVLTGQSGDLAPADGKLYALRDVTGTVQSIPLIASSVMSKKIAAGAQAIVLDVKVGLGAFMTNLEEARQLAELMVAIGRSSGRQVVALLSDMNQPLGSAVGNALELIEAIETLHGGGPVDFREHCIEAGGHLLVLGGKAADLATGKTMISKALTDGSAWEMFRKLVVAQKGDVSFVDDPAKLAHAAIVETVVAPVDGFIQEIHARKVGEAAITLGAGRAKKGDAIDPAVGILVHAKVGDQLVKDQPVFTIHANNLALVEPVRNSLLQAVTWSQVPVQPLPLFYGIVQ